jgi:hypothetical protein
MVSVHNDAGLSSLAFASRPQVGYQEQPGYEVAAKVYTYIGSSGNNIVSVRSHNWLKLCKLMARMSLTVPLLLFFCSYMPVRAACAPVSHSWEQPLHSWENEDDDNLDGWGGECSDDDVEEEPTTPGGELVSYTFGLLMAGTLNSQQFCIAMHYANLGGITEARPYAFPPGKSSGHYARHLLPFIGSAEERAALYELDVPGHRKTEMSRTVHKIPVMPPHEVLAEAMESPAYIATVKEFVANNPMPPAYDDHVVVRSAREADPAAVVLPLCLYMDAVPYSQTDSVLGVWMECLASSQRWLCAMFRKRHVCKCGCKGWCSYHPLFAMLDWSKQAVSRGLWPTNRHDGAGWKPSDQSRSTRSSDRMPCRGAIIFIKGDWAEYAHTVGLPQWSDGMRPCYECVGVGADLYTSHGNSVLGLRWVTNTDDDYHRACDRCEVHVRLTAATKAMVLQYLRYDKRDDGAHGRAIVKDIELLGLRANDRLEPSSVLPDVSKLEDLVVPATVTFWRSREESITRHRNPMFCSSTVTGLGLSSLTVDLLHAVYLGVMNRYCAVVLWFLFGSDVFGTVGTAEENLQAAVLIMKSQLMAFYTNFQRANPTRVLTRVGDLTTKMVGTKWNPKCKTKGAETLGMALFLTDMLQRYAVRLGNDGKRLERAGSALLRMVDIWDSCGRVMEATASRAAFEQYQTHMTCMEPDDMFTPKHHILFHLLYRSGQLGNPRYYASWQSEAKNKLLKSSCRAVSQATFEATVLFRMKHVLRKQLKRPAA